MTSPVDYLPTLPPATCPMGPAAEFALLRETCPVANVALGDGSRVWVLTRYEDVRAVLRDTRFSSVTLRPGFPVDGLPGRDSPEFARSIIRLDEPEHLRLRRMVVADFTPRRVATHEDSVRRIVVERLEAIKSQGSPADFAKDFALAVPSNMISLLLGVPEEDQVFFQDSTRRHTNRDASREEVEESIQELHTYMLKLAEVKRVHPGDDIISKLVAKQTAGEISAYDVASYALLLVAAGHDTTTGAIGLSILTLLQNPEVLARLIEEPDLWPAAVDEFLRLLSVVRGGPRRLATEDVEVGGTMIRAGEGLVASVWAANHDPGQFDRPGQVDLRRDKVASHLAFGVGPHQCLGQSFARLELRVALSELFERFPTLRLDDPSALRFRTDSTNYGLYSLPLSW